MSTFNESEFSVLDKKTLLNIIEVLKYQIGSQAIANINLSYDKHNEILMVHIEEDMTDRKYTIKINMSDTYMESYRKMNNLMNKMIEDANTKKDYSIYLKVDKKLKHLKHDSKSLDEVIASANNKKQVASIIGEPPSKIKKSAVLVSIDGGKKD